MNSGLKPAVSMSTNPTISLVIISNNSEHTIAKTFQSVALLVDEIILIDTGITDSTLDIALSFNAKIYFYKWENNFSKARNFGIEKATGNWIYILDVDEFISEQDIPVIKQAIKDGNAGAFVFLQKSQRETGLPVYVSSIRLFRNLESIRYQFAVHEMLTTEKLKESGLEIRNLNIEIEHTGYQTKEQAKQKAKRNLNILKSQLIKEKLTENQFFHYGVYFLRSNLNSTQPSTLEKTTGEKLIEIKTKLLKENNINLNQDFFLFYAVLPEFLYKYSRTDEINTIFAEATEIYKDSPYIYFKFAELYYKMADYRASIQLLEKCLGFNENEYNKEQLIDPKILDSLSYSALSKCYVQLDDRINSQKYLKLSESQIK